MNGRGFFRIASYKILQGIGIFAIDCRSGDFLGFSAFHGVEGT
ncbi:MAG: hypothetical protein OXF73_10695 [Gammaproteobacteria bacterium]|nr:hypothetical protein [Gammaproteobacteria bacterium]MCY4228979.1 hypothetical protein [Gammaproteobacteria bacterium]